IRHDINRLRTQLTRSLESLMHRREDAIQDQLVTIRNDRFVIPVKAASKGSITGVTHGSSSSGATLFVEPLESIESNNELLALHEAEEREIARILFELTRELAAQVSSIEIAAVAIEELDIVRAKALFADTFKCVEPKIGEEGVLKLVDARHPILEKQLRESGADDKIVPISLAITNEEPALVISGANAGGKTVVLKTVGLLSLMALSGIGCPASEATVPFYHLVVADIGDNQSLSANLSTFTSHISNIRTMIDLCAEASAQRGLSLVLLDEVGTGTDPDEGSALGVAIVDHFRRALRTHTLASTHYRGLKIYAAQEQSVTSASVEFDEKTLRPTYRLLIGMEGASSGLEIARRFGLPKQIINDAASRVSTASLDATRYLAQISHEASVATELRKALEEERRAVAEKYATLEEEMERRASKRQKDFEVQLTEITAQITAQFETKAAEILSRIEDSAARVKLKRETERRTAELRRVQQRAVQDQNLGRKPGVRVIRDGHVVDASS
ncbi:MAG: endonuclease MutS2, partial [Pyrinomonadaceae bacterium]